jgi:hypothetical protein
MHKYHEIKRVSDSVGKNTTIEINGKRYDARTGSLLGEISAPRQTVATTARHTSRVVDGFIRPGKANTSVQQSSHAQVAIKQQPKPAGVASAQKRRSVSEIKPAQSHKPQRAQTLMRKTVKKPEATLKPAIKTQKPSEIAPAQKSTVAVPQLKKSAQNIDENRLVRAGSVNRSQHIKRFAKTEVAAGAGGLVAQASQSSAAAVQAVRQNYQAARGKYDVARPHTIQANQGGRAKNAAASIFEAAIENARSHEQPMHKPAPKPGKRLARIGAAFASVLVLIGFIAYMNMSTIELKVASMQAGFHAQLPSFKPVGYALNGGVHASNGIVSFKFQSGDSSFEVQQQSSNWDSQTLLDNVVATAANSHRTFQNDGRTVYIYGNNATWVNGGVLYNMKVSGDLSNQQVVNVASSM